MRVLLIWLRALCCFVALQVLVTMDSAVTKNAYTTSMTQRCVSQHAQTKIGEVNGVDVDKLRQDLIYSEGLRLKAYRDTVGKLTIGVGHNLDDQGITEDEAIYLLNNDIIDVVRELHKIPGYEKIDGNDVRERVISEMVFNLGVNGVLKFRHMWKAIQKEDWESAANHMLQSRWAEQVGKRAVRLANRMRTGEENEDTP